MHRTPRAFEREEDFQNYVAMAKKTPAEATALLLREQDQARDREIKYRRMDNMRHRALVGGIKAVNQRVDDHEHTPIGDTHLKKGKNGSGKKAKKEPGMTVFGLPIRDVVVLVGILATVLGVGGLSFVGGA